MGINVAYIQLIPINANRNTHTRTDRQADSEQIAIKSVYYIVIHFVYNKNIRYCRQRVWTTWRIMKYETLVNFSFRSTQPACIWRFRVLWFVPQANWQFNLEHAAQRMWQDNAIIEQAQQGVRAWQLEFAFLPELAAWNCARIEIDL